VLVLAWAESAAWTHEAAVAAIHDADWRGARGPADEAALADPDMPAYQMTRGLVASAQEDWQVAADAYRRAASVDDIPMSWLGLAQAQIGLGAADAEVVESIERARRSGSQQPAIAYAAAHLYDRMGMAELADDAYAIALAAFPSLAADPSWVEDAALTPRFAGIIDLAMGRAPEQAWEIALMSGDATRAHALNEAGDGSAFIDLVIEAWEGDREAIEEVYALADAAPGSLQELAWAERIARRAGEAEAAERFGRLVNFASIEGGVIPGAEIRVDRTEWLRHVPAGTLTWYASQWLYRRPGSLDLIPPGLPRLVHAERDPGEDAPPER
jgi:tetratricopeptide (TPR) repeat protein